MKNLIFDRVSTHVGILYFNRPEALNAMDKDTLIELHDFLTNTLRGIKIRVLILTGKLDKAFIAGVDINEMNNMNQQEVQNFSQLGQNVTLLLEEMDIVTIAAVNGYAFSEGLDIALACDFIIASDTAEFGSINVNWGMIPGFGGTYRLARLIGINKAKEMIFSAKKITAKTAYNIGLVNKIYPQDQLIQKSREEADRISRNSFYAIIKAKKAINQGINLSLKEALLLEQEMFTVTFGYKDRKEGMKAFLEKRKPDFSL